MTTSQLNGVNYEVDYQAITFFGANGKQVGDGWIVNGFGGDEFVTFESDSAMLMSDIRDCINEDVSNGHSDKLSMLLLAPPAAVWLYIEGELIRQYFTAASEGPGYIDIPNVDVDGRNLTVRILKEAQYLVATADSEGNML